MSVRRTLVRSLVVIAVLFIGSSALAQVDGGVVARAQTLYGQANAAYEAGRLEEAARLYAETDALLPTPEFAFNIGRCYERMGEAPQAIRYFERYLHDGHPTDAERTDLTTRIAALRAFDRRQHDQIMVAPPSTDEMTAESQRFFLSGVAMFRRHRYDAALRAFTAAYRFAQLPEVIYNLAVASEHTGHTQDAIDYYREYLRARPTDPGRVEIEHHIDTLRIGLH